MDEANLVGKVRENEWLQRVHPLLCHITAWQPRFRLACPSGFPDDVQKVSVACAGQHCMTRAVIP